MLGKVVVLGMLIVAVSSCGGNDAPAQCNALAARMCTRAIACLNDGTTQAECDAEVKTVIPCAQADGVSDGYDACMSEVQTSPCTVLFAGGQLNLPATCNGVILFK